MPYDATVYKVMIASPSDVQNERIIIREVIYEWNAIHSETKRLVVLPVGWESHCSPTMDDKAQNIINSQVLIGCDLLVGVFWTRIGTKTDKYESGSIEEIENHIAQNKTAMLYFSSAKADLDALDYEQHSKLKDFRTKCQTCCLYETYKDTNEFKDKFKRQLQIELNKQNYSNNTNIQNDQSQEILNQTNGVLIISKKAQNILKEASLDPNRLIIYLQNFRETTIQSNKKIIFKGNNPREAAAYDGAMTELENHGLIKAKGTKREIFSLTHEGYSLADTLPDK